jgi:hypothetical protein
MRVLICGGRAFDDLPFFDSTMDKLHERHRFSVVVHGGASGADAMAHFWAGFNSLPIEVYHADWKRHGKADLVVAFPGGRGTADMLRRARAAGIAAHSFEQESADGQS